MTRFRIERITDNGKRLVLADTETAAGAVRQFHLAVGRGWGEDSVIRVLDPRGRVLMTETVPAGRGAA